MLENKILIPNVGKNKTFITSDDKPAGKALKKFHNASNHSIFRSKVFSINRSYIFNPLPKFYARHLRVNITGP
jgi:hypothetical protein